MNNQGGGIKREQGIGGTKRKTRDWMGIPDLECGINVKKMLQFSKKMKENSTFCCFIK